MSRKRRLSPEDKELWERVRRSAAPLGRAERDRAGAFPPGPERPAPFSLPRAEPKAPPLPPFRIGQAGRGTGPSHDLLSPLPDRLAAQPTRMDAGALRRLRKGRSRPEAKLDLHGMTLAEAEGALRRFVLRAHGSGLRLLLIVTGKGRDSADDDPVPARRGALRHQVPVWLARPPLASLVLQVVQAHRSHGGGGAYYVYLRRPR